MRLLLSLLLIPSLAFAAVPSAGPNGENAGGLFSVYFQNMTSITCPAGQVITGFSSSPSTYLTPTCQSIISNESWSLSGNTITPGQYIGTNNNTSLIFRTNASSDTSNKMIITTTGAVGIGTDAPYTALDVNGVTRATSFTDTTNGTWFPWTTTGFNYIRGTTYFSGFLVDEQNINFYINPAQVSVMSGLAISGVITGPTPVAPTQLTTKAYVDAAIANIEGGSDKIVVFSNEYQNKNYDESWDICFGLEPLGSWHIPSQTEIEWGARVYPNIFQPSYFYWTSTRVGGDMQLYYKSSTNLPNRSDWLSVANQGAGTRHTLRCVTLRTNTGTTIISTPSTPSIPSVNGSCSTTANTCTAGTAVSYSSGSCGGNATWICNGSNGGTNASCSVANAACAPVYTYSWQAGGLGSCSVSCGPGSQSRTVYCQRSDGQTVVDGFCTGTKPATSQSCNMGSCGISCRTPGGTTISPGQSIMLYRALVGSAFCHGQSATCNGSTGYLTSSSPYGSQSSVGSAMSFNFGYGWLTMNQTSCSQSYCNTPSVLAPSTGLTTYQYFDTATSRSYSCSNGTSWTSVASTLPSTACFIGSGKYLYNGECASANNRVIYCNAGTLLATDAGTYDQYTMNCR